MCLIGVRTHECAQCRHQWISSRVEVRCLRAEVLKVAQCEDSNCQFKHRMVVADWADCKRCLERFDRKMAAEEEKRKKIERKEAKREERRKNGQQCIQM